MAEIARLLVKNGAAITKRSFIFLLNLNPVVADSILDKANPAQLRAAMKIAKFFESFYGKDLAVFAQDIADIEERARWNAYGRYSMELAITRQGAADLQRKYNNVVRILEKYAPGLLAEPNVNTSPNNENNNNNVNYGNTMRAIFGNE